MKREICRGNYGVRGYWWKRWSDDACVFTGRIFLTIPHKLKAWRQPGTKFVIVMDQDSGDCIQVKRKLQDLASPYGREVLIRIACKELEAWYFGDLRAVSLAYDSDVEKLSQKRKYRIPDSIGNPKEEL